MRVASALPPKITRPQTARVVVRKRLFKAIDEVAAPVVWIAAPPGAGKTSLAASYVESQRLPSLWYRVDGSDRDPATAFYYLTLASAPALRARAPLPLLRADASTDLPAFAQRFFTAWFAQLPRPSIVVVDNYEAARESPFDLVFREGLERVPEGVRVLVLSLVDPPAPFARLVANRVIGVVDGDALRFTRDETGAVVAALTTFDPATAASLHEQSGGWAAGLVLMLEHLRHAGRADGSAAPDSREAAFEYFAGEIFASVPPLNQRTLLLTAALPRLTGRLAQEVSGNPDAERLLDSLVRNRLFTERRSGAETTYRYHALFRAFLQARAAAALDPQVRVAALGIAARSLEADGHAEEAIALQLQARNFDAAARLLDGIARRLYDQGRWRRLLDWIGTLPPDALTARPGLLYWSGACRVFADPPVARRELELAYAGYAAAGDRAGQILCAGALARACILAPHWAPLDRWIDALADLLSGNTRDLPPSTLLTGLSRLVYAAMARQPDRARVNEWANRALSLLPSSTDCNEALMAAFSLMAYYNWIGDTTRQERIVLEMLSVATLPEASPVSLTYWTWARAMFALRVGDAAEALQLIDAAFALADRHGLAIANVIRRYRIAHHLGAGDARTAAAQLRELDRAPRKAPPVEPYHELKAWLALLVGDYRLAVEQAETALRLATERGRTHYRILDLFLLAAAAAEAGDLDGAESFLRQFRALAQGIDGAHFVYLARLLDANVALLRGDRRGCHAHLRAALDLGSRHRYQNHWTWYPKMMARLYAEALEQSIEPGYVRGVISKRGLPPPDPDVEAWPWPIKVYTLGRFVVMKNDQPVEFTGKAQRKPIELLKALIALGGRSVPAERLVDALWPATEETGGQKALEITVHRLRKLLGANGALRVSDRCVTLDPASVWADAWSLDRMLARTVPATDLGWPAIDAVEAVAAQSLRLFRGGFLADDGDAPWQLPLRHRLSGRFQRLVLHLGERWECAGEWSRAAGLYQRATEIEPLLEIFYRRRMVCLRAQGRCAEALEVFRRCRQTLSVTLAVQPSAETIAVYRALQQPANP